MELFARLENIEFQIKQLKQKNNALADENTQLKIQNKELQTRLNTSQEEISSLAETNKITKLARDSSIKDNKELSQKIDSLIQEIDECLILIKQ